MISERLDVETRQEDVVGVRAAKLKEAKASCGHAQGSPEAVYGVAKAEQNAEGRCTGALAVEVEVPPHRVVPSIVLTTPDDDNYEPFPSRANSPVSTTSAASTASSGGSPVHTRLPMHSPPASSQSRSSWSLDPSSKLPVNSTNTLQLLSSLSPSSIGSIPEEPLLEEDIAEQCLYDYKSGDGSVDCITQFTPSKAGEEGVMQSLVTVPKESGGDNINLLSINKPASRKPVHAQRPRAMSLPNAQRESFHRGNLLGEDKSKELQEQTPNSVIEPQRKDSSSMSVQRVSDVLMRAQKWRKKALATKKTGEDSEMTTAEEGRPELHARRRAMTEIPQALHVEMLTEAQCILQRTLKMYQTALGVDHPLAGKAAVKLNEIESQLVED